MHVHHNYVTCWRVMLSNNKLLCFTDSDEDISFDNEVYLAGGYFTPSNICSSNELGEDHCIISGIIDGEIITEDLLNKDFVNAYLEIFALSGREKIVLKAGWVGEIKYSKKSFTAEIQPLSSKTNNIIGKCYSENCRAEFGDQYCGVNKNDYIFAGEITSIEEVNSFIDLSINKDNDWFSGGILKFITGGNINKKFTVTEHIDGKIYLDSLFNLKMNIGDKYQIIVGCDKSITTCVRKFNNAINFRGEPYIPNRHKLVI